MYARKCNKNGIFEKWEAEDEWVGVGRLKIVGRDGQGTNRSRR